MKITLEHYDDKISVEKDSDDLTTAVVFRDLIIPLLIAVGYQQSSIEDCLNLDEIRE